MLYNKTKSLKDKLLTTKSLEEKIHILKDAYFGEECYIITAGPSLKQIDVSSLKDKLKDKLVICVKQTYDVFHEVADFHLLNPYNYKVYDNHKSIVVFVKPKNESFFLPKLLSHVDFEIDSDYSRENSLCNKECYQEFLIDKNITRPYGPGIMHEIGIYLPILLGVKKITFISWDLGSPNNDFINRFYMKKSIKSFLEFSLYRLSKNIYNNHYIRILNSINIFLYNIGFENIILYNPGISENEANFISKSTRSLFEWFKSLNIEVNVISDQSMLDSKFQRKMINEI